MDKRVGPRNRLRKPQINVYIQELEIERLTTALKRVDFPTLGRPTIPALKLMLIFAEENCRVFTSREWVVSGCLSHRRAEFCKREDLSGSATEGRS